MWYFEKAKVLFRSNSTIGRGVKNISRMSDSQVRLNFKRMAEQNRKQRLEKKQRVKATPQDFKEIKLTVLGNGNPGNSASVVVTGSTGGYFFNCGEGLQKVCSEYKIKIPRIQNLFFTSAKWENIGGLPGFCLTGQGMGLLGFNIHGPKSVLKLFESTQGFMRVDFMSFSHHHEDYFEDNLLKVNRIELKSSLQTSGTGSGYFAYVCRAHDKPGQLLLGRCVELGVPVGPLFSKLKLGEEVTLENGNVVKPSDVLSEHGPGPVFIILECPSEDYVESLLSSKLIARHQNVEGSDENYFARCVVHMTPENVYESAIYQKFLQKFPETTYHWHLCESNTSETSPAAYRSLTRLNLIHNEIFPLLPRSRNDGFSPLTSMELRKSILTADPKTEIKIESYIEEATSSENFEEVRERLTERLKSLPPHDHREFPAITFLGTGSSQPTKDRNVSGILVYSTENSCFLLDCGESTWGQMVRAYGVDKAYEILRHLKFVYISHIHADHHLGLFSIIKRRQRAGVNSKLAVIGPKFISPWFARYSKDFEELHCDHKDCRALLLEDQTIEQDFGELSVSRITTCEVDHCPDAFGVRVDLSDYSIVYSGDTRPCKRLIQLGKDCDILIHEATMEDYLADDAKLKGHSTTSQAKEIGKKMNAKFTLLTHFSQRYAKLPLIDDSVFADGRLGLAFDYMRLRPKDLHVLSHIYPMLKCLHSEHFEYMQDKTQKLINKEQILMKKLTE